MTYSWKRSVSCDFFHPFSVGTYSELCDGCGSGSRGPVSETPKMCSETLLWVTSSSPLIQTWGHPERSVTPSSRGKTRGRETWMNVYIINKNLRRKISKVTVCSTSIVVTNRPSPRGVTGEDLSFIVSVTTSLFRSGEFQSWREGRITVLTY